MNRETYRRKWLRLQSRYERRAFVLFRSSLRKSANRVPWEQLDKGNYKMLLEFNINDKEVEKAYYDIYLNIGTSHGKKVGDAIDKEIKAFSPDLFSQTFKNLLIDFIRNTLGLKISTVRKSLVEYLIKEIEKGITAGTPVREIAANMQKLVNSNTFYRWQALRIARTETTAAANFGAISVADTFGVPMDKEWISANDARTRRTPPDRYDHAALDGKTVAQNALFEDNGAFLRFPGDPKAPAGTVINCRCTVALVPKRRADGSIIYN